MNTKPRIPQAYLWLAALVIGVGIYLIYPASLPALLFSGMMLMHLGGHGGHSHGGHRDHSGHTNPPKPNSTPEGNHANHQD